MSVSSANNVIPYLPESAPFSAEQRAWLNGFFAGIFSGGQANQVPEEAASLVEISLLFGSQTGTAEGLAKAMAKYLKANGFLPTVIDLAEMTLDKLQTLERVLLITSTYGEGDPPDNAVEFYRSLMAVEVMDLKNLQYAVFGLGDTNYTEFCKCSHDFDTKLKSLGAKQMITAIACDGDPEELFDSWKAEVVSAFGGSNEVISDRTLEEETGVMYDKKNPFPAPLISADCLNGEGSSKEVYHVEISLENSGIVYEVGDALAVLPKNDFEYVNSFLNLLGYTGEETVTHDGIEVDLKTLLLNHYDIKQLNAVLLKRYHDLNPTDRIEAVLEDKQQVKVFCEEHDLYDLLQINADAFRDAPNELLQLLNPLKPRLYSISSSMKAHPNEVHLTVGKVQYEQNGRQRKGVCSCYLSETIVGSEISVYLHSNKAFRLPEDDSTPVIMIGPGTGIAPFRAFLEEREQRKADGKNWLFFGDQHVATDFLYQEQLDHWLKHGVLTQLDTAFSRDQEKKIYVQNRILEKGKDFYEWLEQGAYVYVCGDASRMAKDVDQAIHTVIEMYGKCSAQEAEAYVRGLKKEKRYLRDVY